MKFTTLAMAALLSLARAVDVQVVYVGKNPVNNATKPQYWPEKITAAPGTMVQFQFWAGNHTVTQSTFDAPCTPITQNANGTAVSPIKSGFMAVAASADIGEIPIYTVMINDTKPLWFYCGKDTHCAGGMSMVINEASGGEKTLEAYKSSSASLTPPGSDSGSDSGNEDGSVPGEIPSEIGDDDQATAGASMLAISKAALLAVGAAALIL